MGDAVADGCAGAEAGGQSSIWKGTYLDRIKTCWNGRTTSELSCLAYQRPSNCYYVLLFERCAPAPCTYERVE